MASNAYTQDVVLDADGKPVVDALAVVQNVVGQIQKTVAGIGLQTRQDAEKWHTQLAQNLQLLKQAQSDLRTLQQDRSNRNQGFADFEKQARAIAQAEVRADKEANSQKLIEARNYYGERQRMAREEANVEKQLAREIADYEKTQDREAIAVAREVAAARREAATAAVTARARGITNRDDALAAKSASDARLSQLRDERRVAAENDTAAARGITNRIEVEKALNRELDTTIRKLGQQAEAEKRASELATARLQGQTFSANKLLAPSSAATAIAAGAAPADVLASAQAEQTAARLQLESAIKNQMLEQITAARQRLELANSNVNAAQREVRAEEQQLELQRQIAIAAERGDQRAAVALARPYSQAQVDSVGVDAARAAAKERVALAEAKVASTTGETRNAALSELEVERARLRAVENIGKEQAIQKRQSIGGRASTAIQNTALYGVVAGAGYAAFGAITSSISNVIQLEDEFAKLQAISNSTDQQMQGLKATIYGIGEGSRFAVGDLVKIAQTLAQAGISAAEMGDVLKSVSTLATASGSTPEEAVNLVTSALGAFQLQASEAARISDLMTTALNRTKLTVTQVGQAIQYVGGTAYENNISLEQLLATIGAVAQGGVKSGSTIGTGFRQFLVDLQNPSEKLMFQLQKLGVTQADVDVKTRGLGAVIDTLKEKGFGASQAYAALENRSAAFYLVAKNNTDVMDELQVSFAQQGATAIANERAMNSLTSQWQRFKNILSEGFSDFMSEPMTVMQNLLSQISDRLVEMRKQAQLMAVRGNFETNNQSTNVGPFGGVNLGRAGQYINDVGNYNIGENLLRPTLRGALNFASYMPGKESAGQLGTWLDNLGKSATKASASYEQFGTAIADANEKVQKHQDTLTEVDKEMGRLRLQQNDLINNQTRSQAETVTLTSRFQGLVRYLGTTKNAYLDLINAMNQYRGSESRFLAEASFGALAEQQNKNNVDQASLSKSIASIRGNADVSKVLGPNILKFLNDPNAAARIAKNDPNDVEARNFTALMATAADRAKGKFDALAKTLNDAATVAGRLTIGTLSVQRTRDRATQAAAAGTGVGVRISGALSNDQADLDRLRDKPQSDRARLGAVLSKSVTAQIGEIQGRLNKTPNADMRKFLQGSIDTLNAMLEQIAAAISPSKEELKEAARKAAELKKEQAEAHKRPFVQQSDLDEALSGLVERSRLRRGHDESDAARAEENSYHARGLTRATADTSDHTRKGGVARDVSVAGMDDAAAQRLATAIDAKLKALGIDAQVLFEHGGKNGGTARHIHIGIRPYTRFGKDRQEGAAAAIQQTADEAQLTGDRAAYETTLTNLSKATTDSAYTGAVTAAQAALEKLNADIKQKAADQLSRKGVVAGMQEYDDAMAAVDQQIAANIAKLQQTIAEGLIKSIEAQVKRAEAAFKRAIQPATDRLATSQGRLQGLDLYSNRNKVPDYVKQLASDRVQQNQESLDRVTASALPARIAAQQAALARAQAAMGTIQSNADTNGTLAEADPAFGNVSAEVDKLTQSLADLQKQKQSLDATLGAGSLIPQTLGAGLEQAIQAYRQANALNNTFAQDLTMNLGGALTQVHNGLTTMFENIMNGSQTALQAFGNFAKGIMQWMIQLAAKAVATQVFNLLLTVLGTAAGGKAGSGGATDAAFIRSNAAAGMQTAFTGGRMGDPPGTIYRAGGGSVENGSVAADSVNLKAARGEWVIQKSAVDSVGNQFMARLNQHGAKALGGLASMPKLDMRSHTETNVYVVPPEQKQQMGPNDVRVILNDELMYGDGKRLVQHIAQDR